MSRGRRGLGVGVSRGRCGLGVGVGAGGEYCGWCMGVGVYVCDERDTSKGVILLCNKHFLKISVNFSFSEHRIEII